LNAGGTLVSVNHRAASDQRQRNHLDYGGTTMLKSRTMAVAGTIAALSLAAAPIASASIDTHSGTSSPDRIQRVDKRSPDRTHSPDPANSRDRTAQRDSTNHR
jgi:hypothetical protein